MATIHNAYYLFRRKVPSGRRVWYYRLYRPDGTRTVPRSTGIEYIPSKSEGSKRKNLSRMKAEAICDKLLAAGRLDFSGNMLFENYAQDWFVPGKCIWLDDRLSGGIPGIPALSASYITSLQMMLRLYIKPFFDQKRLVEITPTLIKSWRTNLKKRNLSNKTVNEAAAVFHIITDSMLADNRIQFDPFRTITRFDEEKNTRRAFTLDEATQILNGKWVSRLFSLTAAVTGMRQSEIRAIRASTLHPTYIDVTDQFYRDRLAVLKTKESRKVPIPPRLYDLLKCMTDKPFVFSFPGESEPMSRSSIVESLAKLLPKEECVDENGKKKMQPLEGLCFHSWRHFFNSWLVREGVTAEKIRAVMGHSDGKGKMTANYTTWTMDMYSEVYSAQEKLLDTLGV